jgi:hypothetical protein
VKKTPNIVKFHSKKPNIGKFQSKVLKISFDFYVFHQSPINSTKVPLVPPKSRSTKVPLQIRKRDFGGKQRDFGGIKVNLTKPLALHCTLEMGLWWKTVGLWWNFKK